MKDAHRRAERCFALARSTTFPGERKAAIDRGIVIAEKAGLNLDHFDIPGRARPKPTSERLFEGDGWLGDNFRYVVVDPVDVEAMLNRIRETILRRADVEAENRRRRYQSRIDDAVRFLRARGNVVRSFEDGTYTIDGHHAENARIPASVILMAAQSRGWRG